MATLALVNEKIVTVDERFSIASLLPCQHGNPAE
jgi:hypothetical protein